MTIKTRELVQIFTKIAYINPNLVKLETKNKKLYIKTFNNYAKVQCEIDLKKNPDEFNILINLKILSSLLSKINQEEITIAQEAGKLMISYDRSNYNLNAMAEENFPDFNLNVDKTFINANLTLAQLGDIARYITEYAVNNASDGTKLSATDCISICTKNNSLYAEATDVKRLAILKINDQCKDNLNLLIYSKTFTQLIHLLSADKNAQVFSNTKNLLVQTNNCIIEIDLIAQNFPDLVSAVKDQDQNVVEIDVKTLIDRLETGNSILGTSSFPIVNFGFKSKDLLLSFKSSEQGNACENIDYKKIKGEMPDFSININYLLTALKNITSKTTKLSIKDNLSPLFIYDLSNKNLLQVILPSKNIY